VFRTGLDGILNPHTHERVGVNLMCGPDGNFEGYSAWYQMIPGNSSPVIMSHPLAGDTINASVTATGPGTYALNVADLTHAALGFPSPQNTKCHKGVACKNSSAEVTAGSPGPGTWGGFPAGTRPPTSGASPSPRSS
jgi:hypothetical protein